MILFQDPLSLSLEADIPQDFYPGPCFSSFYKLCKMPTTSATICMLVTPKSLFPDQLSLSSSASTHLTAQWTFPLDCPPMHFKLKEFRLQICPLSCNPRTNSYPRRHPIQESRRKLRFLPPFLNADPSLTILCPQLYLTNPFFFILTGTTLLWVAPSPITQNPALLAPCLRLATSQVVPCTRQFRSKTKT